MGKKILIEIRESTNKAWALGSDTFKQSEHCKTRGASSRTQSTRVRLQLMRYLKETNRA